MKIIPIGIYGPYPAAGGATSCYLVDSGKTKVVIDLGSGALSALKGFIDIEKIDAYVLTHLHYDHFCDALPLAYEQGDKIIYAPSTPSECFCLLKERKNYDMRVLSEGLRFQVGELGFEFMRTKHPVECYSVKVHEGNNFFVYTSDTLWDDKLVLFCRGAKLVLADCCSAANAPHMTAEDGARLEKLSGAKVIATHVPPYGEAATDCKSAGIELIIERKAITVW